MQGRALDADSRLSMLRVAITDRSLDGEALPEMQEKTGVILVPHLNLKCGTSAEPVRNQDNQCGTAVIF